MQSKLLNEVCIKNKKWNKSNHLELAKGKRADELKRCEIQVNKLFQQCVDIHQVLWNPIQTKQSDQRQQKGDTNDKRSWKVPELFIKHKKKNEKTSECARLFCLQV